jgi:lipopolysaccharide transport system ATP-binding protein
MGEVAGEGRTVLFVSHNMTTLQSLCQRAYLLNGGQIVKQGEARSVVHTYLESVSEIATVALSERSDRQGDGDTRFSSITIESAVGLQTLPVGTPLRVRLEYSGRQQLRNARVMVAIMDVTRTGIFLLDSDVRGGLPDVLPASGTLVCDTGALLASPGLCYVNIWLYRTGTLTDFVMNVASFHVVDGDPYELGRLPSREWAVGVIDQTWHLGEKDGLVESSATVGDFRE